MPEISIDKVDTRKLARVYIALALAQDEAHHARLARRHAPCGRVRVIVQLAGGRQHPLARLRADAHTGHVVEDEGDGGARHPGQLGDFASSRPSGHANSHC